MIHLVCGANLKVQCDNVYVIIPIIEEKIVSSRERVRLDGKLHILFLLSNLPFVSAKNRSCEESDGTQPPRLILIK